MLTELQQIGLIYESSVLLVENPDKRIAYLWNKYHNALLAVITMDRHGSGNLMDYILEADDELSHDQRLEGEYQQMFAKYVAEHPNADANDEKVGEELNKYAVTLLANQVAKFFVIYTVKQVDPTHGKYSDWFLKMLTAAPSGDIEWLHALMCAGSYIEETDNELEDFYKVTDYFKAYERFKGSLPVEQRDINAFKTIKEFEKVGVALSLKDKKTRMKGLRDNLNPDELDTVMSDVEGWDVVIPLTVDASIAIGGTTEWCTADEREEYNAFDDYNEKGPLFIFLNHDEPKYQLHVAIGDGSDIELQMMDEADAECYFNELPPTVVKAFLRAISTTFPAIAQFIISELEEDYPNLL